MNGEVPLGFKRVAPRIRQEVMYRHPDDFGPNLSDEQYREQLIAYSIKTLDPNALTGCIRQHVADGIELTHIDDLKERSTR
jgi:hypothetical protein